MADSNSNPPNPVRFVSLQRHQLDPDFEDLPGDVDFTEQNMSAKFGPDFSSSAKVSSATRITRLPGTMRVDPQNDKLDDALPGEFLNLSTAFKYDRLSESNESQIFRLLVVMGFGAFPTISLKEKEVTARKYIALSYAWGREANARAMFCNFASFAISEHVLAALNYLCLIRLDVNKDRSQWYWIDAICIDQTCGEEKAKQVAMMGDIYINASLVLIWLGPEEEDSTLALDNVRTATWAAARKVGAAHDFVDLHLDEVQREPNPRAWRAIGKLFLRAWFHRMWTIQEFLLAADIGIACGQRAVKFWAFSDLAKALQMAKPILWDENDSEEDRLKIRQGVETFVHLCELRSDGAVVDGLEDGDLLGLLNLSRLRDCTLPVDRIWSLLGLARPELRNALSAFVDYSESGIRNYHCAYINFARTFLHTDSHLALFSYTTSLGAAQNCPSWVPDYNTRPSSQYAPLINTERQYHAGVPLNSDPVQTATICFPPCTTSLIINGFCIDFVEEVVVPTFQAADARTEISYADIKAWEEECLLLARRATSTPKYQKRLIPPSHWRTLVGNCMASNDGTPSRCTPETESAYYHFILFLKHKTPQQGEWFLPLSDEEFSNAARYWRAVSLLMYSYRYFCTKDGRVGLGPKGMKKGDAVVVFGGARVPHLVRFAWASGCIGLSEEEGDRRVTGKLIGDAYVDELMEGEVFGLEVEEERIILE